MAAQLQRRPPQPVGPLANIVRREFSATFLLFVYPRRGGGRWAFHVGFQETVESVKAKISATADVPVDGFYLSINLLGKVLRDGLTLSDYGLCNGSSLSFNLRMRGSAPSPTPITLTILLSTGKRISHKTTTDVTFAALKTEIAAITGIPTERQCFRLAGGHKFADADKISTFQRTTFARPEALLILQFAMTVQIEHGATFEIVPRRTVASVKRAVELKYGICPQQQTVRWKGRALVEDDATLFEYGVAFDDSLVISFYSAANQQTIVRDILQSKDILPILHNARKLETFLGKCQQRVNAVSSMCALSELSRSVIPELRYMIEKAAQPGMAMRRRTSEAKQRMSADHGTQMTHFLSFRGHYETQTAVLARQIAGNEEKLNVALKGKEQETLKANLIELKQLRAAKISFFGEHYSLIRAKLESLFEVRVRELDDVQKDVERVVELEERLKETIACKLRVFEQAYESWSVVDTLQWLRIIDNARFDDDAFGGFCENAKRFEIDGSLFSDLSSSLLLKSMGLKKAADREAVRRNVNRVVAHRMDCAYKNRCGICVVAHIDTVLLPCGHQFFCRECADVSRAAMARCPVCRQRVTEVRPTYLAGFSKVSPSAEFQATDEKVRDRMKGNQNKQNAVVVSEQQVHDEEEWDEEEEDESDYDSEDEYSS